MTEGVPPTADDQLAVWVRVGGGALGGQAEGLDEGHDLRVGEQPPVVRLATGARLTHP